MLLGKYAVPLIQIVTIIVTSLVSANADGLVSLVEALQIGAIGIGGIVAYFVPLLENGWAATLKFIAVLAGAAIAAIIPIVDTANGGAGWSGSALLVVILAVLNAALTALGVTVRLDAAKEALESPDVSDRIPIAVDGKAVRVVLASGTLG